MKFTRTGLVLCTEKYAECVDFYTNVLELSVMFNFDNLTCCDLGDGSYIMIETGGMAIGGQKTTSQNPIYLRFNVEDVDAAADHIRAKGVEVEVFGAEWGKSATFVDPDGNICSFREEQTFLP